MAQGEAGGEPRVGAGVNKRLLLEVGQAAVPWAGAEAEGMEEVEDWITV